MGIYRRSVFSLDEVQQLLPIIFRITKQYSQRVEVLIERLDSLNGKNEESVMALEAQVNKLIQEWQGKMHRLGALPKGLWLADFDAGDGYFCWKFPERSIEFWHSYSDGYSKRVHVSDRTKPAPLPEQMRRNLMGDLVPHLRPSELSE